MLAMRAMLGWVKVVYVGNEESIIYEGLEKRACVGGRVARETGGGALRAEDSAFGDELLESLTRTGGIWRQVFESGRNSQSFVVEQKAVAGTKALSPAWKACGSTAQPLRACLS